MAYGKVDAGSFTPETPLAELGLDSVYALTLCGDIEDPFDLEVDPTIVWDHPTIRSLAARHLRPARGGGVSEPTVQPAASARARRGRDETGVYWRRGDWRAAEIGLDACADRPVPTSVRGSAELGRRAPRSAGDWVQDLVTSRLGVEWPGFAVVAPRRKPVRSAAAAST